MVIVRGGKAKAQTRRGGSARGRAGGVCGDRGDGGAAQLHVRAVEILGNAEGVDGVCRVLGREYRRQVLLPRVLKYLTLQLDFQHR